METIWRFKINGEEVEEPIGWDAVQFTLQRDAVFHGLENIFSDNIKFWGIGADIITEAYEQDGIDGTLDWDVSYSCDGGDSYNSYPTAILNCFFYEVINKEVTIKIEPSGFHRKVKNRLNTPVNLMSNTSIGGEAMSSIGPFDLGMHSKTIVKYSSSKTNTELQTVTDSHTFPFSTPKINDINMPFEIVVNELQTINEATTIFLFDTAPGSNDPVFIINEDGELVFTYKIKGALKHLCADITTFNFNLHLSWGNTTSDNQTILQSGFYNNNPGGVLQTITYDYSGSLTIPAGNLGKKIWIVMNVINYRNFNTSPNPSNFELDTDLTSGCTITQSTTQLPSNGKVFLVHEVFAKMAESITDIPDSFRSNFFGQTNSQPHQYLEPGCGAWTAISNGLNIRKMLDRDGNIYPIVSTFQDFFNSCDAVWNLGMKIEKDGTGKEYIRVEPKEYFYNAETILNVFQVSDLKRSPAQDKIFNTFKVGYEKWNMNITGSNALDEFNSDRNYTIPVRNASEKLEAVSKIISSGYLIEQTRRLQYVEAPTNDFETDNDLFFICTNRTGVTTDLYTVPPVSTTYSAGTVSERDENFTGIGKVLSPPTCYNLRLSPVRMGENWYKYISASIWKNPTGAIKFTSGTGNYIELDTMINDCVISGSVIQNQDLLASDISGTGGKPIYLPEYLEFSYPLSSDEFNSILENSEKAIQVSCGDSGQFIGFIESLKHGPTTQGGIGEFKLIRGQCVLGDFNNDFNNDFFTGTC